MDHINKKVSVLTNVAIRYEATLSAIVPDMHCIQFTQLDCKGIENRTTTENIAITPNANNLSSLTFRNDEIVNITLINANGVLTDNVTSEILQLFVDNNNTTNNNNDDNDVADAKNNDINYLFSIGIIADPQYADTVTRYNYSKSRIRRYRNALNITKNAIKTWNEKDKPLFIVCLGDIIDGINKRLKTSQKCLKQILNEFNKFKASNKALLIKNITNYSLNKHLLQLTDNDNDDKCIPQFPYFHNLIGNHELYNFDRQQLMQYFYSPDANDNIDVMTPRFYYSFSPFPNYVFIMLNCYEISIIGYNYSDNKLDKMDSSHYNLQSQSQDNVSMGSMHPNKRIATSLLNKYNSDNNKNNIPNDFGDGQRWTGFNGGFGSIQLKWLQNELIQIEKLNNNMNVILFGHIPIWCRMSNNNNGLRGNERILCWDYAEIHKIIQKYKIVKMYIAGHKHGGECIKDSNGVWHRTIEGVIESSLDKNCFGTMYFYADKAILKGYGLQGGVFQFR